MEHVESEQDASPFDTISQQIQGRSQDVNGWWFDLGQLCARLLQLGQHSLHDQYRHLLFLAETIIPALGPYPSRYRSAMTVLEAPVDTSLKFYQDGPPLVRLALEPLNDQSGTPADPFNQLPTTELVSALAKLNLPGFDAAIYHHFAKYFVLSTADAARLSEKGLLGTQSAFGFEFRAGNVLPKGYVFMRLSHIASGTPIRELILQSVASAGTELKSDWMPGLTVVDEYIMSAGGHSEFSFFAWDYVSPALSRLKLYGAHLQVNLTVAEEVWTLGGRFNDPEAHTGWELFQRLWDLLGIKPHEVKVPDTIEAVEKPVSEYEGPLLWNYEIKPRSARPIAKLYICVHGQNDLAVARGLSEFFASLGWNEPASSYVDALASMYPDVDISKTSRLQSWISFSYTEAKGVDMSVYYYGSRRYPWSD